MIIQSIFTGFGKKLLGFLKSVCLILGIGLVLVVAAYPIWYFSPWTNYLIIGLCILFSYFAIRDFKESLQQFKKYLVKVSEYETYNDLSEIYHLCDDSTRVKVFIWNKKERSSQLFSEYDSDSNDAKRCQEKYNFNRYIEFDNIGDACRHFETRTITRGENDKRRLSSSLFVYLYCS